MVATVVCRIQHHPARAHLLPPLKAALFGLPVEVIEDNGDRVNPWRAYRACLEPPAPTRATHVLVIQDDTQPCTGFPQALTEALAGAGDCPVALFVSRQALRTAPRFQLALQRGEPWCEWDLREGWVNVVALVWPVAVIPEFLAWCDSRGYHSGFWRADDAIVGEFMRKTGRTVLATVPCLVEHPDVEPSVAQPRRVSRNGIRRLAVAFRDA